MRVTKLVKKFYIHCNNLPQLEKIYSSTNIDPMNQLSKFYIYNPSIISSIQEKLQMNNNCSLFALHLMKLTLQG